MRNLFYIPLLFLFACNHQIEQSTENTETEFATEIKDSTTIEKKVNPNQEFIDFYQQFIQAISTQSSLESFKHSDFGLYVIKNNGALPELLHLYNDSQLFQSIVFINKTEKNSNFITQTPIFEELPMVICEDEIYSKPGCFAQELNPLIESGIWNFSDLNEKEKQAIQFAAESVNITVINTHFFTFYFSKTNEGFKVVFIDARTPCAA